MLPHEWTPAQPAPQPRRALESLLARGRAHLVLHVFEETTTSVSQEQPQRLIEAPAVEIRIQVPEAW